MVRTRSAPAVWRRSAMSRAVMEMRGGVLLVATGVGEVGDDRRDPGGAGSFGGVDHHEEFHEVVLHRRGQGLDNEDIPFPQAFLKAHEEVVVGEALGGAFA